MAPPIVVGPHNGQLQAMPRSFKKLRELDLETLVADLMKDLSASAKRPQEQEEQQQGDGKAST